MAPEWYRVGLTIDNVGRERKRTYDLACVRTRSSGIRKAGKQFICRRALTTAVARLCTITHFAGHPHPPTPYRETKEVFSRIARNGACLGRWQGDGD